MSIVKSKISINRGKRYIEYSVELQLSMEKRCVTNLLLSQHATMSNKIRDITKDRFILYILSIYYKQDSKCEKLKKLWSADVYRQQFLHIVLKDRQLLDKNWQITLGKYKWADNGQKNATGSRFYHARTYSWVLDRWSVNKKKGTQVVCFRGRKKVRRSERE